MNRHTLLPIIDRLLEPALHRDTLHEYYLLMWHLQAYVSGTLLLI